MRIAMLTSLYESVPPLTKNGLEMMVSYLTEELVERGHQVSLFATADSKTKARLISVYPYAVSRDPKALWPAWVYELWNTAKCLEMSQEFDLIHSHNGNVIAQFLDLIKKPIVRTVHSPVRKNLGTHYKKPYYPYMKSGLKKITKIYRVCISYYQKKQSKMPRTFVVHNGLPLAQFEFNNHPKDYFAYLGYLTYEKGAHLAIEVAKKTKSNLKIAGNFDPDSPYFKTAVKPYLGKKIQYLGPLRFKEKIQLLKNAQALLFPIQWNEPFGLVMIEALACGTPVIAFKRGAVPEIVKHGRTGFVVQNLKQMTSTLKKIKTIDRKRCRKYVEKYFSVERMTDQYERIYQYALSHFK